MKSIIILCLAGSIIFTACQNNSSPTEEKVHEHHAEAEIKNTTTLNASQIKSIQIELCRIEKKQLTASLKANGLLRVPNNNRANAATLLGGVIQNILVQTGNTVKKGQVIATLANQSFITMQEDYLTTCAKTEQAELDYQRQKTLRDGNAGALKNLQNAETELKILKGRQVSLKKQLELIGINPTQLNNQNILTVLQIKSPIAGTISHIMVNVGANIEANNPIAEIVDNSQLHLDLYVYEKDLSKMKVGQTIHFTLTNNPGNEYDADVYAISNTFEKNMKAIAIHANVKGNKQGLIDGMSITALISLDHATVDAVPSKAIVNHDGQDYIFIIVSGHQHGENELQDKDITFEKIPVMKGRTDIGYSEITLLKDIPKNSRVVSNGAFFILAKMTNQGESHTH